MNRHIFVYIFFISALSCNNSTQGLDYMKNVVPLRGEPLQIEQLIGDPNTITTYMDSLLIYYDRYKGKSFSVFDLKNNHFVGRFVSEGQGPNEVIPIVHLLAYPQKDNLYAYQSNAAIISVFDVTDFHIQNNIQITSSTPWRPFEMQRSKDYYIGMGIFEGGRFGVYNSKGEFLYMGGTYPYQGKDMESQKAFMMYQAHFCANPDKNYFVAGCSYSDHITFYEIKEDAIIPIKEYYSYDSTVDYEGRLVTRNNSILSYAWAFGTSSYCYMLFSGKTYEENKKSTRGGNYIIVFDWQGNYIKTFNIDYNILSFCVDEINNYIYAAARDENGENVIIKVKILLMR